MASYYGPIAQLVERIVRNDEVSGSIPLGSIRLAPGGLAHGRPGRGQGNALSESSESKGATVGS